MSQLGITTIKIVFFVALYLFVLRVLRVMYLDIAGPGARRRKRRPPPPPRVQTRPSGANTAKVSAIAVSDNGTASKVFKLELGKPTTIGRSSECTVVVNDTYASQMHTRFFEKGGVWMVEDCGSTNGTLLNRVKVMDPTPIAPGDEVRLGKTIIEVRSK